MIFVKIFYGEYAYCLTKAGYLAGEHWIHVMNEWGVRRTL